MAEPVTTTLCEVRIPVTGVQRKALLFACKRLGLDWESMILRIKAACQDAAVRRMADFTKVANAPEEVAGYPDCGKCWAMRAETCARCGKTQSPIAEYETPADIVYEVR